MTITLHLSPEAAAAVRAGREESPPSREILRAVRELGIDLRPVDPGGADPSLAGLFSVQVADLDAAGRAVARLRGTPGVESAYVKPPDALP
ncbi:MAG TPA: hypothetical protein VHG28_06140 [Longimicrobiaceae bacterium]|nr:hypothetical protein [Longimicrobiaceae bacterium]